MDNYFEHIQEYLDGNLLPEDRQQFERELETNAALQSETDDQRMLRAALEKQLAAEATVPALRATLTEASDRHFGGALRKKKTSIIRWLGPLAAAAIILFVFNLRGWFMTDYEALPTMPTTVTRGTTGDRTFIQAAEAYHAENYSEAINLLQTLTAADTTVIRYRYYLGLSYLGKTDYPQAVEWLQPIADGRSVFAEDACYFTAVAFWRLNRLEEAQAYVARITKTSEYYQKAEKLHQKLIN